jgi:hypothetical protein
MRKIGVLFIILGCIELLASIFNFTNDMSTGITMLIIAVCFASLGLILFKTGTQRKKKAIENGEKYKEASWGKIILWIFISLFLFGVIGSIVNKLTENTIHGQISKENELCPIEVIKNVATITKIADENNQIVYYMNYDDSRIDLSYLENNPNTANFVLLNSFGILNGQGISNGDKCAQFLLKNNYGVAFDVSSANNHFRISIDGKELKEKVKLGKIPTEAIKDFLDMQIKLSKSRLPQKVDEGMMNTDIFIENNNIICKLVVDENTWSISNFKANASQMKEELYKDLASEVSSRALLNLCKIAHTGIIYRIIGNTTKDSCDVIIDNNYISSHTMTPNQLNIK